MSKRAQCKFFAHGACFKGEYCEFSHNWTDPPNNVCTFYQKGACAYGNRCRYEHVKAPRTQSSGSSSSASIQSVSLVSPILTSSGGVSSLSGTPLEVSASKKTLSPSTKPVWNRVFESHDYPEDDIVGDSRSDNPSDLSICSFAAAGSCPRGETCPYIHGDLCPSCGKHCLHPFRLDEREEHVKSCEKKQNQLDALKRSQDIECSVCLDRVLSKSTAAERKFGLLSECDHPFCISCIRNWRSSSPDFGMDMNSALRACPICRKLSYFIIPSVIWYSNKEEKQEIIDSYKAKLMSIHCKHFNFGDGSCPFGTSCFYKHAYRDGQLEEISLRHLGNDEGLTVIAKDIRLSDFFRDLHIR